MSGQCSIVSVTRWAPSLRASDASTGSEKKIQTWAPLPERERSRTARHTLASACRQERQRIVLPRLLVEISRQEPAGLVRHERIDTGNERLRPARLSKVSSL